MLHIKITLKFLLFFSALTSSSFGSNDTLPSDCKEESSFPQPLIERKKREGKVRLIGLFDVHEGENCHLLNPRGIEQVMMVIGELENQLTLSDLDSSEIGFEVYDTCYNTSTALWNLIQALKLSQTVQKSCGSPHYTAVIGPLNTDIQQHVQSLLQAIKVPYFPLQVTSLREEIKAMSDILLDLKWLSVAIFSSSKSLDLEFRKEANRNDICIASSTLLSKDTRSDTYLKKKFQEITALGIQVAVVLGSSIDLHKLYQVALATNSSIQYWLVAGLETKDSLLSIVFGPDHPVILLRRSPLNVPIIDRTIEDAYSFSDKINRLNLVQNYIDYVSNCLKNSSGTIFNEIRCQNHQFKTQSPLWHIVEEAVGSFIEDVNNSGVVEVETSDNHTEIDVVNLRSDSNGTAEEIEIWTFQHAIGKYSKHKELLVGHYNDGHLVWDKKRLNVFRFTGSGWFKIPEFQCRQNCPEICENFQNISLTTDLENLLNRIYFWKYETWITILMTTSSVGIVIALLIGAYLISRACREDFEEGNQTSNVVLLITVIISFSCSALFLLQNDTATCSKRIAVVGLAYASMLAPILSRCFLLIASEVDGVHGHISGMLQFVLSFFIFAVQVAMASYYWLMTTIESKRFRPKCTIHTKMTVTYLSYPILLSLVWLITSPFCIRNIRNNREGLLLHLGSIAVCIIWLVWCLLFFLLDPRWNEFTICFGLVATASAILLVIYLPKVYRMIVFSAARDHGQVSMQPVIFASTSSRSPNPSIYESINHGYNPDKDGYGVDVFRDDLDSPAPRKMTHL